MTKIQYILIAILATSGSLALANKDLATKNGCLSCHSADNKIVGPSYKDVAAKYKTQKDAVVTLTKSIKEGGSGKWGPVPMPAQAQLSDTDATTLATWVLAGGK